MLESGETIESIEQKNKRGIKKEEQLTIEEDSLYKYCLEHSYNYWVIHYMIINYGKSVEEAIEAYLENGQQIPTKWVYEKYEVLFKYLTLNFGLDSNRIIKIMKEESCNVEEAITRLIFISNNQYNDFKLIEINWMQELYLFLKDLSSEEIPNAIKTFYISERELSFLKEKGTKIEVIKRQLLLYEFSTILDNWETEDIVEMLHLYNISDEELYFIITELHNPFDNKVINPTENHLKKKDYISNVIKNNSISEEDINNDNFLSDDEKRIIIYKRQLLRSLMTPAPNDKKIK